ncbi:RP1 protein, partial [Rhinopomastus cyanomelas]|nr:RP1 protein [Rhinopomastus cyanomelas]
MSETPSTSYSVNQPNYSESEQSLSTRHANVAEPVVAKRICFYKSGDPQFNGIKMVINTRSYKTFDALLDSLSKRVPLPFGVRNISTPKGRHSITNLEDLEDGKSYICSHQRKMKPINLEQASKKPLPWQISRPISARRRAVQLARENEDGYGHRAIKITTPRKMLVFKNGDVRLRRTIVLGKKNTQTFEAFLDYMSELMQYPVVKLYTTDGRKVPNLQALVLCSGAVVAAGREPFKPSNYDSLGYSRPAKLLGIANRVYPKANAKSDSENTRAEMGSSSRSQIFSVSSDIRSSNDNSNDNSDSPYVPDNQSVIEGNQLVAGEELSVAQYEDDIEKSVHLNQDGSITVEMKVRFKIKEEETIKWTTTVSRAGLTDDKNTTVCNAVMQAEDTLSNVNASDCINPKDSSFQKSCNKEQADSLQQFDADMSDKESESDLKSDSDNTCKMNSSADVDVSSAPEDNIRPRFYRPPTPGPRRVRQKKAVVESVTLVSEKEVQEKTVGQFSYSEETQNGANKSEYCMVAQSSIKKSSVINPQCSELSDGDAVKLSSESVKEEILFKVSHKSSDFDPVEMTDRKTKEVSDEGELVQNGSEKSAVAQSTSNSKANVGSFMQSSKISQAARPGSADHIHGSCEIKKIKRSVSSFISYSALCYSKSSTEEVSSTTGFFPGAAESEDQISVGTESVTAPHLNDDSQSAASSITKKKKKKKKSSKLLEQGTYEIQKDEGVSEITRSEGKHMASATTQDSKIEATENPSEKSQKKETEFLVKNNVVSVNSDRRISPEDESYQQESVEQNGSPNKKQRSNNKKLARAKLKSDKKSSVISPTKGEDGLMTIDSNNASPHSQDTLSIEKEGTHLITHSFRETPNSSVILKPLTEGPKNFNLEKDKNILENMSLKKEKKQKGVKKNLSKGSSKLNVSQRAITLEALKQEHFQEQIVEQSLESYVQTWLKSLLPSTVLPPIKKRGGTVASSNVCDFSEENTDASIDKKPTFITNEVPGSRKNHLTEHNLRKKTLKPICDLGTLEESAKDSVEKQTDSLIRADRTAVETAKCSLKSEFHDDGKQHLFHETQDNDKNMLQADSQDTNLCQRKKSEVAVQVDCTIVREKMGIDVQNSCMSTVLLHELQSALLDLQKEHNGCVAKACSLSDLAPSAFGPSSNVLLAWLLVLNLSESLMGTIKDNLQKTPCSCSEILTQLQYLKQTTTAEKVDELKAAFSHFQKSTGNNLLKFGKELKAQDCTHCQENTPISETRVGICVHENERSVEPCIPEDDV